MCRYKIYFQDFIYNESFENSNLMNNLFLTSFHIGYRLLEAIIFGIFNSEPISKWQIRIVFFIHFISFLHLVLMRPYKKIFLLVSELITTICECGILISLVFISENEKTNSAVSSTLSYLSFTLMFTVIGYEILTLIRIFSLIFQKYLKKGFIGRYKIRIMNGKQEP